jgi:hypothetical protein
MDGCIHKRYGYKIKWFNQVNNMAPVYHQRFIQNRRESLSYLFLRLSCGLLLSVLLISCSHRPSSVLQDSRCTMPCWGNMIPGRTSKEQALSILSTLGEVDTNSIKNYVSPNYYDYVQWSFKPGSGDDFGQVYFVNDIISTIIIYPNKNSLSTEKAILKLGKPEKVLAIYDAIEFKSWLSIYLMSSRDGYVLFLEKDNFNPQNQAEIKPNNPVGAVFFIDPSSFEEVLMKNQMLKIKSEDLLNNTQAWKDYGRISYIISTNHGLK